MGGELVTEWDYIFLIVPEGKENTWSKLQDDCKRMGAEGWELVTITENLNTRKSYPIQYWVFKKPKQ